MRSKRFPEWNHDALRPRFPVRSPEAGGVKAGFADPMRRAWAIVGRPWAARRFFDTMVVLGQQARRPGVCRDAVGQFLADLSLDFLSRILVGAQHACVP